MYKSILYKCIHAVRASVWHANSRLGNYDDVVWLIGDGRSGTTWVASLLNHDKKYREMFEPFHPKLVNETRFLLPHQYVRPRESNDRLERIASRIFSGKFVHPRVDAGNRALLHNGLLVKDIFANLFARWVFVHFPKIKIILLIRNPFAVALSKYKKKNWFWVTDPMTLLNQHSLHQDYLYRFESLIRETASENDYILNQILIWSILHYVPLRQFELGQIHTVFYEEIHANPNNTIANLFAEGLKRVPSSPIIDERIIDRPSRFAGKESNISQRKSPVTSWKKELPARQIDSGLRILQAFGFDKLYDDAAMPNRRALEEIHNQK